MKSPQTNRRTNRRTSFSLLKLLSVSALVLSGQSAQAGTLRTFASGTDLTNVNGYSPTGTLSNANDVLISTFPAAGGGLFIGAAGLTIESLNDTDTGGAITISDNTATSRTLTLGNSTAQADAATGSAATDLLFVGSGAALTLQGANSASLAGTLNTVLTQSGNFDAVGALNISTVVSGAFNITKTGAGTLTLSAANTYTGATTVNAGTLALSTFTGSVAGSDVTVNNGGILTIDSAAGTAAASVTRANSLTLNGGTTTTVTGTTTGNTNDVITNALTVNRGANAVAVNPNASGVNATLSAGSLVRNNNATVLFTGTTLGAQAPGTGASTSNILFGTAPTAQLIGGGGALNTVTTSIIPYAIGGAVGSTGTDFVTYNATNGVQTLTTYAADLVTDPAANAKLTSAQAVTANGGPYTVNSLILGSGGSVTSSTGGITLNVTSGAILGTTSTSSIGTPTAVLFGPGTLALGSAEGVFTAVSGATLTINTGITGSGGLTTSGAGMVLLNGSNTYTGTTTVNQGTLQFGSGTANTTGTLTGNTSDIVVNTGALLQFGRTSGTSTFVNNITGAGNLNATGGGTTVLNGNNSYTGTTYIGAGTLVLGGANTATGGVIINSGATLRLTNANAVQNTTVNLGNGSSQSSTLDLRSDSSTIFNSAANGFTVLQNNTGNFVVGAVTTPANATTTLTIGRLGEVTGSNQDFFNFTSPNTGYTLQINNIQGSKFILNPTSASVNIAGGSISNTSALLNLRGTAAGNTLSATVSGGSPLIKTESSTWTVNGPNTYTGQTAIVDGTATGGSTVIVNSLAIGSGTAPATSLGAASVAQNAASQLLINSATLEFNGSSNGTTSKLFTIGAGGATLNGSGTGGTPFAFTNTGAIVSQDIANHTVTAGTSVTVSDNTNIGLLDIPVGATITVGSSSATVNAISYNYGNSGITSETLNLSAAVTAGTATFTVPSRTLTLTGSTGGSLASVLADSTGGGKLGVTKTGTGAWTVSGANTYTGATTVAANGGTLTVDSGTAGTGRLGGTSGLTINTGGTLLLAQTGTASTDRINNSATVTMAGGMLSMANGSKEGVASTISGGMVTGTSTIGLGALTLTANSTLNFDSASNGNQLVFANGFTPGGFTLTISNYTNSHFDGALNSGLGTDDRLVFDQNMASFLTSFDFGAGAGVGVSEIPLDTGFYEVGFTAVPEPSSLVGGFLMLGVVGLHQRRRLWSLLVSRA